MRSTIVASVRGWRADGIFGKPSISVKLSALHPRYEEKQEARVHGRAAAARQRTRRARRSALDIGLTIDAEEVNRLDLSLELFGRLAHDPALTGWNGLGLAVQAYGKRAMPVLEWLAELASQTGTHKLPVRLVKGAYWDTEIKRAQEAGYRRLSGLHPQGLDRCQLSRLRPLSAVAARCLLSAIRHPQCPSARRGRGHGGR